MHFLGIFVGLVNLALLAVLLWRASQSGRLADLPFLNTYLVYVLLGSALGFVVYWYWPTAHASVYWFYYVLSILVEFAVLLEISDHIFQPFPAIRNLGRALTILLSVTLGLTYILPAIVSSQSMRLALLDFALRASLTKAAILFALFFAARHLGIELGRNVAGLMLGFSIYIGVNVANFACVERFGNEYASILWVMSPLAYTLCLLVWIAALWEFAPMPRKDRKDSVAHAAGADSETLAIELARFNNALSRFLNK
jgi:hypothetical protein